MRKGKRKFMVVPRNQRVAEQGLQTAKGRLSFKNKTALYTSDPALASEIDTEHGLKGNRDVYVFEDEKMESTIRDEGGGIHHYQFGSTRRYAENFDRIFRKNEREAEYAAKEGQKEHKLQHSETA